MSSKVYSIALIGCGQMGAAHLDNIYYKDNIKIQFVCDLDYAKANEFAKKYNAETAETNWKTAVSAVGVDIVIVATPPSSHLEILKACIAEGKHVLCEKPIAGNLSDGADAVKLIREHPECKVLIGHILRHNKTYQTAAAMIQSGAIGSPIIMRMAQNHHTINWKRYLNLICETSPIVDCGVHYVDVMRWFTGEEVKEVSAIGIRTEADVPNGKYNYGLMTVRLSNGSIGYYEAGWSNTMSADNLKEFIGPRGRIKIVLQNARHENQEEGDLIEYYTYPEKEYRTINVPCKRKPTDAQLNVLIDMIENNSAGTPTIDDVWTSFQTVIEADKQITEGLLRVQNKFQEE